MAGCTNGRRGCSGVQRSGARGGGGSWQSRWDGDGVGGCAQCSMRPGPNRLIGNTHRSSCARGISHVCSIVGGGGGGEGKKSGAGGGRRRKEGKRGTHTLTGTSKPTWPPVRKTATHSVHKLTLGIPARVRSSDSFVSL